MITSCKGDAHDVSKEFDPIESEKKSNFSPSTMVITDTAI